jgi:ferredoxin
MTDRNLRVTVDQGMCLRAHSCIRTAPGIFHQAEDGSTAVTLHDGEDESAIVAAAEECPNFAISVLRGDEVLFDPGLQ